MDTGLSTAQRSFLKDVTEREKRLRSLKNDTITHATEISALQEDLREKYQSLIIEHPSYGIAIVCKDVEEKLWKLCFYVKIEEYRKSIRKTVILRDGKEDGAAIPATGSLALKAGTHLAKLISAFTKFLFDGMSFYQDFMLKLESSSKKLEIGHNSVGGGNLNLNVNFVQCVFRCLMYLGDLARYRELYCESKDKDFSEAERYYERASFLSYNSGHPHNQLAVLSSYSDTDCLAVYHYCRSVMILKPFASGYDNLGLIFDKNMRAYSALKVDASDNRTHSPLGDKKQILAARAHIFFVRFLRLHGDLFKWSRSVADLQKDKAAVEEEANKRETPVPDFDVTACMSLIQRVLSDFEYFMRFDESSVFSEMLLVKLLAISIFSVHNAPSIASPGGEAGREKEKDRAAAETLDCSITESLALYFLFNFISRCAALFSMIPSSVSKMIESNVRRVLPVLTVFADWCCLNPRYLGYSSLGRDGKYNKRDKEKEKASGVHRNGEQSQRMQRAESMRAPETLLKAEEEARSSMISCISFLDSYVKSSTTPTTGAAHSSGRGAHGNGRHNEQRSPLKEDIELRGFLPLKNSTNVWSADLKGLSIALPIAVPDELARNRRLKDLSAFIEKLKSVPRPLQKINRDVVTESHGGVSLERGDKQKQSRRGYAEDTSDLEDEKEKSAARPGLLHVSVGISNAIRQKEKEKERERINERTNIKMGDLRELIAEEQEHRDQIGKKGRRESSPKPDDEKREQRAGLLIVAPGVLTAARQKDRDRERYMEQSTKIRGERRPGGKLVDTRTSVVKSSAKSRDKDKEGLKRAAFINAQQVGSAEKPSSAPLNHRSVNGSERNTEEFPPLPGAREPVTHAPATLNYAASALFTPAAPDNMDPFANDDSDVETASVVDEDEDEAGLDVFQVCDIEVVGDDEGEGEGDIFNERSQWNYSVGYTSGPSSTVTAPPPSLLQTDSAVSPSGAFSGLFSGLSSGSNMSFYQYADSSENIMSTTSTAQKAIPDDDDFADDVIVFRPAFSRINTCSSSLPPPPPLSYIGGSLSSLETPQQPLSHNGLPPALDFAYGSRGNRAYETEINHINHTTPQPQLETNWQSWDKRGSLSLYENENGSGGYSSIPTPVPNPMPISIPMGSMIFNDPSPCRYSAPRDLTEDSHTHSHSQQDALISNDNWWAGSSLSDSQTAAIEPFNHQNPSGSDYAYTRGSRGPPALQHVPNGWDARQRGEGALPLAMAPPGLLPPPPGFSSTINGAQSSQYPYSYMQQQQGQVDSRVPSNFFNSNG